MADFDTPVSQPASSVNYIEPGKMPLSAMSPVIVVNEKSGDVELVTGSAGSRAIITTNAWVSLLSCLYIGRLLIEHVAPPICTI